MMRAALLRRSCDGVAAATESLLRRSCADQLRRAHSARRVRDGADAARSAAPATELRRSRCCDGAARGPAPSRSTAHSARRVSTRRAERGASIISPHDDLNFNGRGPQS